MVLDLRALRGDVRAVRADHDAPRRGRGAIGSGHRSRGRRQRRSAAAVDRSVGARVRPVARDHQCDHAMVGGGAVPVDRAAQPLSADLRHRLRPATPLSAAAVRCGLLLLAGTTFLPAPPEVDPGIPLPIGTPVGDAVCRLHDLPWRDREAAAHARAPAQVLPRHRGRRSSRRGAGDARGPTRVQRLFRAPARLVHDRGARRHARAATDRYAPSALARASGRLPRGALFLGRPGCGSLARAGARARSGRARAQFLRRREGSARGRRGHQAIEPRHAAGRRRPGRAISEPRAPHGACLRLRQGERAGPSRRAQRQAPRRRA